MSALLEMDGDARPHFVFFSFSCQRPSHKKTALTVDKRFQRMFKDPEFSSAGIFLGPSPSTAVLVTQRPFLFFLLFVFVLPASTVKRKRA